jgi:hypothetical protein
MIFGQLKRQTSPDDAATDNRYVYFLAHRLKPLLYINMNYHIRLWGSISDRRPIYSVMLMA